MPLRKAWENTALERLEEIARKSLSAYLGVQLHSKRLGGKYESSKRDDFQDQNVFFIFGLYTEQQAKDLAECLRQIPMDGGRPDYNTLVIKSDAKGHDSYCVGFDFTDTIIRKVLEAPEKHICLGPGLASRITGLQEVLPSFQSQAAGKKAVPA